MKSLAQKHLKSLALLAFISTLGPVDGCSGSESIAEAERGSAETRQNITRPPLPLPPLDPLIAAKVEAEANAIHSEKSLSNVSSN